MSKRSSNGWSDIVDVEDGPPERTVVEPRTFPDDTPVDPRPAVTADPPARTLRMPMPNEARRAEPVPTEDLQVPAPGAPPRPAAARPAPRPAAAPPSFSGEAFVDRLGAGVASPRESRASRWQEYRELIVTASLGALLLGGAIAWRISSRSAAQSHEPTPTASAPATPTPAPPEPTAPPTAQEAVAETEAPEASAAPTVVRSATPMLSIITVPAGADLEIGGEYVGRSPFISTAPSGTGQLRVVATKDGYERAEAVVSANESGHLSTTMVLVPKSNGRR